MLQAVIFDLDGVIVDSHPAHQRAWKIFLSSVGKDVSEADLAFVLEGRKRKDILTHFLGHLTDEQVALYGQQKEALFKDSAQDLRTINGVTDFVQALARENLRLAIASSASRSRAEYTLRQLSLHGHFPVVVTGDDVARGKPDPALFNLAADTLRVQPEDVLVCEDAVHGVEAAKTAGMKCLAIASNGREAMLRKAGADIVVADFTAADVNVLRKLFEQPA